MEAALKRTRVKLDFLPYIDVLLMAENVSEVEYATQFINMQKLLTNTRKIMINIKNLHIITVEM